MSFEVPLAAGSESLIRTEEPVLRERRVLMGELECSDGGSRTNILLSSLRMLRSHRLWLCF